MRESKLFMFVGFSIGGTCDDFYPHFLERSRVLEKHFKFLL